MSRNNMFEFINQIQSEMGLHSFENASDMPLIVDNKPYILQDSYSQIYLSRMVTFRNSILTFDNEFGVMRDLNRMGALGELTNYSFVKSDTDKFIQISDCIIACLSKTFKFLDENDIESLVILEVKESFIKNMRHLKSLIDRSDNKSILLILNLNAQSLTRERYMKLGVICARQLD